ncbi:PIN domain-containing protein [Nannocystaceae bacterium ST9]
MFPAPFRVVLDANVLFPFSLRDTLLWAAYEDWYQPYWSDQILAEMHRNLVHKQQMTLEQADRLRQQMMKIFPAAMMTGYESLIEAMHNDPKDRHVAAVAVKAGAQVIVTSNLRDFRTLPEGLEAQSPDEFLSNLFDLDPEAMTTLVEAQAAKLRKPPRTFDEMLTGLGKLVPNFAVLIRDHVRLSNRD